MNTSNDEIREAVRAKYGSLAEGTISGCGTSCCDSDSDITDMIGDAYDTVDGYVAEADLQLGCGVPTEHAGLQPGQSVVDLGSGAGLDAFVARRIVGDTGRVIGVDFAPEMVAKATANAEQLGFDNVSFLEGDIEDIPLEAGTADVVLSNCVLNLVPDKARAFAEIHRILKPGGHFTVSDIVSEGTLPDPIQRSAELYAGCVAGALDEADYLAHITNAGFDDVAMHTRRRIDIPDKALPDNLSETDRAAFAESGLFSITVQGTKSPSTPRIQEQPDMPELNVYDPPMCCSTGVCGPETDDTRVNFSGALRWLRRHGVEVTRYNPSTTPEAFMDTQIVYDALMSEGQDVLPLLILDGEIVHKGDYPSKEALTQLVGLTPA